MWPSLKREGQSSVPAIIETGLEISGNVPFNIKLFSDVGFFASAAANRP